MNKKLIAGNWKMNGSLDANAKVLNAVKLVCEGKRNIEVVVCAPYIFLPQVKAAANEANFLVGAQDVSNFPNGAYTGDVSATMLTQMGVRYVIVGHSERRNLHQESEALIVEKAKAAIASGITPIYCVGEPQTSRVWRQHLQYVESQVNAAVTALGDEARNIVLAYEPIWAIGTGVSATLSEAVEMHRHIKYVLKNNNLEDSNIRVLYGGSVNAENIDDFIACEEVDGVLVGGASLVSETFTSIVDKSHISICNS